MNYNYLRYFSVLAQLEHYSLAAARLEISQPSLSAAIRALEDELGVALFEKVGRNIRLTEYGRYFRDRVCRSLDELNDAMEVLKLGRENARIQIRIGYISSALETLLVPRIKKQLQGDQRFSFQLTEGSTRQLIEQLRREELDMIICAEWNRDRSLLFQKLGSIGYCVCMPPEHPLSRMKRVDMQLLRSYPLIGYNSSAGSGVEARARAHPGEVGLVCEVSSAHAGLALAKAGVGLVIVPDIPAFHDPDLVRLPVDELRKNVYLCTLQDKWLEPPVWDFAQSLRRRQPG